MNCVSLYAFVVLGFVLVVVLLLHVHSSGRLVVVNL